MHKNKILITGSSGFIGKELIKKLSKRKDVLLYLISNKTKIDYKSDNIRIIFCSLEAKKKLKQKLSSLKINHVIHCAWVGVDSKNRNSNKQTKNLNIINNIIESLDKSNIKCFIGIGSQAEYGPKKQVITETSKLNPITIYGKAKVSVYNNLKNNCIRKNIRFVWLRVFSGYGPGSGTKWIIPNTIQSLIYKKKIAFTGGEQIYNFIYISDIVMAITKSLFNKKVNGAYNLAYKKSYKIKSIVKLIFSILKIKRNPSFGSIKYRKDQIMNFLPTISRLKKDLNWEPKIGIKKGLNKNIIYLKKININT